MQSAYFCRMLDIGLDIYIPEATSFMMYFEQEAVQVDLDRSYLADPDTAQERARAIAAESGLEPHFLRPENRTTGTLPDIPTHYQFVCCPRSISDLSTKIGLGYIGPKVRHIIRAARFPVLMTATVFKPWQSVAVLFGGSESSCNALASGLRIAERAGVPLDVFVQKEHEAAFYENRLQAAGLEGALNGQVRQWRWFKDGDFAVNLYTVPHNALVLSGAYGHGVIKHVLFGGKLETAQGTLTNNMLLNGPHAVADLKAA
jgi:hypothetical protein